ncbi:hypothetical protein DDB_G0290293 [Dictyostelium discoideum AX4]|uniref:hypothetical protein n=1 Tax=Dictyostelium discoideum AX4 TaxID=352472 RepID=UPI00004E5050|nr:hypothetical protein DDB_G0290293 [Dictyostelium discoideum AX4]EAL62273.1 hypothetical protein DDB_G0290293 [Dictyostelium discoideum AX4]|eukprot:XP_635776.1 hypothetical protein DDB_G0290293 [Dictyostelium discoideum AX4]
MEDNSKPFERFSNDASHNFSWTMSLLMISICPRAASMVDGKREDNQFFPCVQLSLLQDSNGSVVIVSTTTTGTTSGTQPDKYPFVVDDQMILLSTQHVDSVSD